MIIRILAKLRSILFPILHLTTFGSMVLLIDNEGVLLIRQSYGSGDWTLPGGGVKRGESSREAALREIREEVGAIPANESEIELFGLYLREAGGWKDHIALYVLRDWSLSSSDSREIAEMHQFPLGALPSNVAPSVRARLSELVDGAPIPDRW